MTAAASPPAPAGMVATQAAVIEARGLRAARGQRLVVRDLDLTVPAGATVALLGANGTGKSSLLALLAGIRSPHGGELRVLGHALPRDRWALRGQVGLVAHEPLLYRDLTIAENLRHHARLHGLPAARVGELLERTELTARADQPVYALSRGLTQRAAVARALLAEPPLLLLDEPLANLDPVAAGLVARLTGPAPSRTRVVASHDPEAAVREADLVVVLGAGARVRHVGPAGALSPRELEELYR